MELDLLRGQTFDFDPETYDARVYEYFRLLPDDQLFRCYLLLRRSIVGSDPIDSRALGGDYAICVFLHFHGLFRMKTKDVWVGDDLDVHYTFTPTHRGRLLVFLYQILHRDGLFRDL